MIIVTLPNHRGDHVLVWYSVKKRGPPEHTPCQQQVWDLGAGETNICSIYLSDVLYYSNRLFSLCSYHFWALSLFHFIGGRDFAMQGVVFMPQNPQQGSPPPPPPPISTAGKTKFFLSTWKLCNHWVARGKINSLIKRVSWIVIILIIGWINNYYVTYFLQLHPSHLSVITIT